MHRIDAEAGAPQFQKMRLWAVRGSTEHVNWNWFPFRWQEERTESKQETVDIFGNPLR
jgi:hypothetical protein